MLLVQHQLWFSISSGSGSARERGLDLPVDELKLDRSFITAMQHDERARGLVKSIIDLAHSLGLEVVAEG